MFKKLDFSSFINKIKLKNISKAQAYYGALTGLVILALITASLMLIKRGKQSSITQTNQQQEHQQEALRQRRAVLAHGKQTYVIKTDHPKNPQILQVTLDPLDAKIGEEQIITVKIKHAGEEPITNKNKVMATYYTDNGSNTIRLKLKRADGPPLITIWQGVWIPEDSYDNIYMCSVHAKSAAGMSKVDLSFR